MDAIELLEHQHEETEELFDRFQAGSDSEERGELVRTVIRDLRLHATIEEEIFYPAVAERLGMDEEILEDLEEHHVVELVLDELEGMDPGDERFSAKVEVLSELVEHHVEEEEGELFPEIREQLDDEVLSELGRRMRERAQELEAQAEADEATKEELYERAKELDISGRSQMSKRELAEAVRNAG